MPSEALATPVYTRQKPSPRYTELLVQYQQMHLHGSVSSGIPSDQMFPGVSLAPQAQRIKALITHTGSKTLLDYGCGKAMLHRGGPIQTAPGQVYPSLHHYWGLESVTLYDPAYPPYNNLPTGTFDAVICTDVLEHCPREDIEWIVGELFAYANKFVFANIACYPARKTLPNGENAHCTVEPAAWWNTTIERIASAYPHVQYQFLVTEVVAAPSGPQKVESTIQKLMRPS